MLVRKAVSLGATDGKRPVQRLKAWLRRLIPRGARQMRGKTLYTLDWGPGQEPSAAGPSEVLLAIARDQVDEQIGQDCAASNRPASRGLRICAWGRHAVA
jgi:hypothetical protein